MLNILYDAWFEYMKDNIGELPGDLSFDRFIKDLKNSISLEADLKAFHEKFGVPMNEKPDFVNEDLLKFRVNFIKEELAELEKAIEEKDMVEVADALIDIVYVTVGFATILGIPFQEIWDEVHKTNMAKVSGKEVREKEIETLKAPRHDTDVLKPLDWKGPNIKRFL